MELGGNGSRVRGVGHGTGCVGVWLLALGCSGLTAEAPVALAGDPGPDVLRVLFIGNSYTAVNDLPGMLSRIAATAGAPPVIEVERVVRDGARLFDHWNQGDAQARINERGWTHVVLQEQSVEPIADYYQVTFEDSLFPEYARRFGELAVAAGAVPTWYATWARAPGDVIYGLTDINPTALQDTLTSAYAKVAQSQPGSVLACVGEAFRRSAAEHPEIAIIQSDLSHPTIAGTYLAAATFYVALTGNPVPEASEVPEGVDATVAPVLRDIARIGTSCADVRARGLVRMFADPYESLLDFHAISTLSYSYGVAGIPVARRFYLVNAGDQPAGLADAQALALPFGWTTGGYPGTSEPDARGTPPCSEAIPGRSMCTLSVTYAGTGGATGSLALNVTNAYTSDVRIALTARYTDGALLSLFLEGQLRPIASGHLGAPPRTGKIDVPLGQTQPFHVIVHNHGGGPVRSLSLASGLTLPFSWGQTPTGETFPGGTGSVVVDGASHDYCTGALEPGQRCVLGFQVTPTQLGCRAFRLAVAYISTSSQDMETGFITGCGIAAAPGSP